MGIGTGIKGHRGLVASQVALAARVAALARPHWRWLLIALAGTGASGLLGAGAPLAMRQIIDAALPSRDLGAVALMAMAILGLPLLATLFSTVANYAVAWLGQRLACGLRQRAFENLLDQSMAFYDEARSGELASRLTGDASAILRLVMEGIPHLFGGACTALVVAVVMVWLNPELAAISLLAFPALFLPARIAGGKARQLGQQTMEVQGRIGHFLQESFGGIRVLQTECRESAWAEQFRELNRVLLGLWARTAWLDMFWESWFNRLLHAAGLAVVFSAGVYEAFQGRLTLGALVAFLAYVPQLYGAISMVVLVNLRWQQNLAALEHVFSLIDLASAVADRPGAYDLGRARGQVRFSRVSFAYPGTYPGTCLDGSTERREAAVREVDLEALPGELVGLVGASGSGKSTLIDLLLRFYEPDDGGVLLDGHDLREVSLRSLRANVAVVPQDVFLLDASLRENVLVGRPGATDEELLTASRAAALEAFVQTLPQGYDTVVGERGVRLSGGERQRLGLARALLKDAPVLVLDEPTSALDGITEGVIVANLRRLARVRTVIVVAHRLSTVVSADRIYVLDRGRVVAHGRHEELLGECPTYAQLYQSQVRMLGESATAGHGL